jgi:hypothetical protein
VESRGFTPVRKKGSHDLGGPLHAAIKGEGESGVPKKKDNALLIQELRALRGRLIESDILGMSTDRDESRRWTSQCRYQAIVEDQPN